MVKKCNKSFIIEEKAVVIVKYLWFTRNKAVCDMLLLENNPFGLVPKPPFLAASPQHVSDYLPIAICPDVF